MLVAASVLRISSLKVSLWPTELELSDREAGTYLVACQMLVDAVLELLQEGQAQHEAEEQPELGLVMFSCN